MRKFALIAVAAVVTGLIVGFAIAGSGDDGGGGKQATTPELEPLPGSSSLDEGATGPDRGTTGDKGSTDQSGGASEPSTPAPTPGNSGGGAAAPQDTETNDTPPPSGSPAERFERFCEENPGAC